MSLLELPHTSACLVCGRTNPIGLHLSLHVDPATGTIHTSFTPTGNHVGFDGLIHGGLLATVLDEAMVWAAIWQSRRACVAGELTVRYRNPGRVGVPLTCVATITQARSRLIETTGELRTADGIVIAAGTGKYVPLPPGDSKAFLNTFVSHPDTDQAAGILRAHQ